MSRSLRDDFGIGGLPAGPRRLLARAPYLAGAGAAGVLVVVTVSPLSGALVAGAYLLVGALAAPSLRLRWLLPLVGVFAAFLVPLMGTAVVVGALALTGRPIEGLALAAAAVAAAATVLAGNPVVASSTRTRLGVIGSPLQASRLRDELARSRHKGFEVVTTITPDEWALDAAALDSPYLSSLSQIGRTIDERDLELLVVTHEFPREKVNEQLYHEVITRPVGVLDLHEFHELRFGSVPLAEIDYSWFTELAGKHSGLLNKFAKRCFDLTVAIPALLVFVPLLAVYAIAVRGQGPALFRQQRVGRGGRPFTIYKLRTMSDAPGEASDWTTRDDPRITRWGGLLRRAHLDEAPQLWNVARGEMSLVGPRPEQVAYVEELAAEIPFYMQRHIVKPGVTGWAQVRLGYSGSVTGTTFKLCNDLYYIKHQTILLDLAILLETVRTFTGHAQWAPPPVTSETMLGGRDAPVLTPDGDERAFGG